MRAVFGKSDLKRLLAGETRPRRADESELRRLAVTPGPDELARLADVQGQLGVATRRLNEIEEELSRLAANQIGEAEVAAALADFDSVWDALVPREQARVLQLLIERVDHDGQRGNVSITFRPSGIDALAAELATEEAA